MHSNLAQLGLVLSILLSAMVPLGLFWGGVFKQRNLKIILENIILLQFIFVSFAFISLSYAYISSDFSLYNVYRNSHQAVPLIYKFSGLWSNHEGSMLLWLFLMSLMNFVFTQNKLSERVKIWIYSVQIIILSSIICYTILKSNPFVKLMPAPLEGRGFNPLLQDVGLAIHPPILYLGYVSSIIAFAISIAALIHKELSTSMLELMKKWTLFSWSFLTLGVALGGWWAYRELGWGGYWFWDPVENASLLPWLTSTALVHSIYASKKLNNNYKWTILLALSTFLLVILTSFIVRSGIVTSVHSFASDTNRGIFILGLLACYSFVSLGLFAARAQYLNSSKENNWLSRFGGINIANIFWVIAVFILLLSLIYPLLVETYMGEELSIDRSFFEKTFIPVLIFILGVMAFTLPTTWQNILPIHYRHFVYSLILASLVTFCFYYYNVPSLISGIAFFTGILVVVRMGFWLYQRLHSPLTYKFLLIWTVHLAAGLFALNVAYTETNSQELLINLKEGTAIKFGSFDISYKNRKSVAVDNYLAGRVILEVKENDKEIAVLQPEIRYYPIEKSQTSEVSTYHNIFYDLYAVISETTKDGNVAVKLYFKPMISWLWGIIGLVFLCGILLIFNFKKKTNAPA